jgi:hypothetical protein
LAALLARPFSYGDLTASRTAAVGAFATERLQLLRHNFRKFPRQVRRVKRSDLSAFERSPSPAGTDIPGPR